MEDQKDGRLSQELITPRSMMQNSLSIEERTGVEPLLEHLAKSTC